MYVSTKGDYFGHLRINTRRQNVNARMKMNPYSLSLSKWWSEFSDVAMSSFSSSLISCDFAKKCDTDLVAVMRARLNSIDRRGRLTGVNGRLRFRRRHTNVAAVENLSLVLRQRYHFRLDPCIGRRKSYCDAIDTVLTRTPTFDARYLTRFGSRAESRDWNLGINGLSLTKYFKLFRNTRINLSYIGYLFMRLWF